MTRPALTDPERPLTMPDSVSAMRLARLAAEASGELGRAKYASRRTCVVVTWRRVALPAESRTDPPPSRFTVELRREDGRAMEGDDQHILSHALSKMGDGLEVMDWSNVPEAGFLVATVGRTPARAASLAETMEDTCRS